MEYDPSGLPNSAEDEPAQSFTYGHDNAAETPADDDDDYDPSSYVTEENATTPNIQAHDIAPPEQTSKPRTVGGFIIEESDDEEESAPAPSQMNGAGGTHSGLDAAATSHATAEDVPLVSEPTQDSAAAQQQSDSLNGSATTAVPLHFTPDTSLASHDAVSALASAPLIAADGEGKQITAHAEDDKHDLATPQSSVNGTLVPPQPDSNIATSAMTTVTASAQRLPLDKVGRLEDRIKDDPKADTEAWWELVQYYRDKDQLDNARKIFDRMLEVWPTSPAVYLAYLDLENSVFDRARIDFLFNSSLPTIPSLPLWTAYLSYLRRVFPLVPDPQGENRKIITSGFEAVLNAVGIDPDSGGLWRDYIDFISSGPGALGQTGWQDMQKVDLLRKAYQRCVKVPTEELVRVWKEYDHFEMTYNKSAGRKVLQEQSPHYMTARTAEKQLRNIIVGLHRDGDESSRILPTLPPIEGCEGDDAFADQVGKWRTWIEWEKSDPLVLKDDEIALYRKRIVFVYTQATIHLRFYPKIWFEAAQWCFEQVGVEEMINQGVTFLDEGLKANPESVMLTLKKADRLEDGMQADGSDETAIKNGEKLDVVFETCLKHLYDFNKKVTERKEKAVAEVKEYFASLPPDEDEAEHQIANGDDDDDNEADDSPVEKPKTRQEQLQERISAVQATYRSQADIMKKTISYVWIAKMRAFRRIQGQGKPQAAKKGFRGVFAEARPRGQLNAEVYVASALMEWHCYKDPSALKIFERGLKLFPTDEWFAVEYMRHLLFAGQGDVVNARVVFETTITKISNAKTYTEAEKKAKIRPLITFMHEYESQYGDLAAILKLEGRMKEMYPDEPEASRFALRFDKPALFDGMGVQLVLSPSQARPKLAVAPPQNDVSTLTVPGEESQLRLGPNGPYMASPKRPLDDDGTDTDTPRKYMRTESPLKGAAGRRVQSHVPTTSLSGSVTNTPSGTITISGGSSNSGYMTRNYVPATSPAYPGNAGSGTGPAALPLQPVQLPRDVMYLLSILPAARTYPNFPVPPNKIIDLLLRQDLEAVRAGIGRR